MPTPDPAFAGTWYSLEDLYPALRSTAVKRPDPKLLGFVLLSPSRTHVWHGPGFRPVGAGLPGHAVWPDRASAARAARALKLAIGVGSVPAPLRVA